MQALYQLSYTPVGENEIMHELFLQCKSGEENFLGRPKAGRSHG